jgi:O-antigen ligase
VLERANEAIAHGAPGALGAASAVGVALSVVAALAGVYPLVFFVLAVPLVVVSFNDTVAAAVLVALTSPVVALGSLDTGFHLLPSYVLLAAGAAGILTRHSVREARLDAVDGLLVGFAVVTLAVTLANVGVGPNSTVVGAEGANAPSIRPLAQLLAALAMIALYALMRVAAAERPQAVDAVVRALLVGCAFVAAYGAYQFVGQRLDLPFTFVNERRTVSSLPAGADYVRINSTLPEASPLAQLMLVPAFIGIAAWLGARAAPPWLPQRWAPPLAVISTAVIVATASKAGWLALALWLPFLALLTSGWAARRQRWPLTGVAIAAAMALALFALGPARAGPISSTIESERYVRAGYWLTSLEIMEEHPLGIGLGNYPFYFPRYAPISGDYEFQAQITDAHNLFLELGVETGILGGLLFAAFIVSLLGRGLVAALRPKRRRESALLIPLTAAAAAGATMHLSYSYFYYPFEWVLLGLVAALGAAERQASKDGAPDAPS